ncbi:MULTISPECIES: hypothetical protein [Kitasatospora]|uniref:Uncharacterized protein n=1 Tax=Kitasatospora setae (strain ATCC 33774 / DSM 43861 / JCM 3304 / KCC A-0304 / NBRC 14216 / KM-6054) TaxID=452652 RepID=E4N179_KITSK|nr:MULTISPECIES: hypothetical protein [Kitasatospora]BAJ31913.1 hypothetical protein KSE_61470 [Kitasatospora setae KM-6054]
MLAEFSPEVGRCVPATGPRALAAGRVAAETLAAAANSVAPHPN